MLLYHFLNEVQIRELIRPPILFFRHYLRFRPDSENKKNEFLVNLIPGRVNALDSFNIIRMNNLFPSESHISTLLRIQFQSINIFKININHVDCLTIKCFCMCNDRLSSINKFFSIFASLCSDRRYVIITSKNDCLS